MARVTVEDCVTKVPNRFDLVLYAGQRSRQISSGAQLLVDRDRDKNPVVALREIADDHIDPADMMEDIIHSDQRYVEVDEPEEDNMDVLMTPGEGSGGPSMKEIMEKDVQHANLEQDTLEDEDDANIIEPEDE